MRDHILFYLNGNKIQSGGDRVFQSLSDFLRYDLRLTGTKIVCEEGDCGACTVLVGRMVDGILTYRSANSCIQYLYQLDGTHIITVEGLSQQGNLTPVQQAMIVHHGSQCGFCTPGFVVSLTELFHRKARVTENELRYALTGNLCRCTGYTPILEAGMSLSGREACPLPEFPEHEAMCANLLAASVGSVEIRSNDPVATSHTHIAMLPSTVHEALQYKHAHPDAVLVSGGTDIAVPLNKGRIPPHRLLVLSKLTELTRIEREPDTLIAGACASWTDLETKMRAMVTEFHRVLTVFGSPQIKNIGTIGGNIANGSPIADSLPFLYAVEAQLELTSVRGSRTIPIERFYTGYKQLDLADDELITRVLIPIPKADQTLKLYRVTKRKGMDIATFGAGIRMTCVNGRITAVTIAYGGVGPTVVRLAQTEAFLTGKFFTLRTMQTAGELARLEIEPISDVRASKAYRLQLAENILIKFFYDCNSPAARQESSSISSVEDGIVTFAPSRLSDL